MGEFDVWGPVITVHMDNGTRLTLDSGPQRNSRGEFTTVRTLHICPRADEGGRLTGTPLLLDPEQFLPLVRDLLSDVPADELVRLLRPARRRTPE
jgi:hypothetical protein